MAASTSGKPKFLRSILLIAVMLGVGAALGIVLYAVREEPPRRQVASLPPLVDSMVVRAEDVVERFVGYGTVKAVRRASLGAEVAATVIERVNDIRAGSVVDKGQLLVRLDNREYRHLAERADALAAAEQAALDELAVEARSLEKLIKTAEQELRVAHDERARVAELFERELAAKKEYDFASLAHQQARRVLQGYQRELAKIGPRQARLTATKRGYEAEAQLAQLNIERCQIKAPFAGRIQSLLVDVGDRVGPGSVMLTLIDASRVELPIQLPAAVYDRVSVGAPCRVESESMPGVFWHGEVARIAPDADEQARTFAVYVVVDNTDPEPQASACATPGAPFSRSESGGPVDQVGGDNLSPSLCSAKDGVPADSVDSRGLKPAARGTLVPGTFVRAEVRGPVYPDSILVPRGACRDGRVLVVEQAIARARPVTIQRFIEDRALVNGDLNSGDRVILSQLDKLAEGSPVRIRAELSAAQDRKPAAGEHPEASAGSKKSGPADPTYPLDSSP